MQLGCGYGNSSGSSSTGPTSGLSERAFVSVLNPTALSPLLEIVNAEKDQFTASTVTVGGSSAGQMFSGANSTTLVFDPSNNGLSVIDNVKEALIGSQIGLPGATESIVSSTDGKFAYAASRSTSQVAVINLTASPVTVTPILTVPEARRLVLSHNNSKLLAFSDDLNTFTVINTADNSMQTVSGTGLDRPTFAVFSPDDTKAYVLNCGAECGGMTASVSAIDMSASPPAVSQTTALDGATVAISDASNLYIAGTGASGGKLDVVSISGLALSKSIPIGNGFHNVISAFQNKILVGARTCTTGCLSIVDASGGEAIVDQSKGDLTAIAPITPRKVFYVAEGGELRIYDATTGVEETVNGAPQIDLVGNVIGVVYVGPKT
jgi:CBS domain-containing protein